MRPRRSIDAMQRLRITLAVLLGAVAASAVLDSKAAPEDPAQPLAQGVAHDALFAVAFDGDDGLAVGAPGRILVSDDGGRSWTLDRTFPSALAVLGADIGQGRAIAVGQMGEVHLRDAQGRWTAAVSGSTERLFGVSVNRAGLAVAVGGFGAVIKSTDHGASWQALPVDWTPFLNEDQLLQGIQPHLFAVDVSDQGAITMAGEFGLILRSTDGGASWSALSDSARSGGEAAVFALELRADGVGHAVGQDGLVLRSEDGGAHWTRVPVPTRANLLGVRSKGPRVLVSAMHDMIASHDGGRSWARVQSSDVQAGWYSGVAVADDRFLAVGHGGRIIDVGF